MLSTTPVVLWVKTPEGHAEIILCGLPTPARTTWSCRSIRPSLASQGPMIQKLLGLLAPNVGRSLDNQNNFFAVPNRS